MRPRVWLIAAVLLAPACGGSTETHHDAAPPPVASTSGRWLEDTIAYAQRYGFFEGESVAEAARRVRAEQTEESGEAIDPKDELATLLVLGYDRSRVWWNDTESDVGPGNDMYVETLHGLAAISRGRFEPENVDEDWDEDYDAGATWIDVSYELDGVPKSLTPAYVDDYLDLEILCEINEQISRSDIRYEMVEPFDQTAYVVALTEREHEGLVRLVPKLRRDPCGIAGDAAELGREAESDAMDDARYP